MERKGVEQPSQNTGETHNPQIGGAESGAVFRQTTRRQGQTGGAGGAVDIDAELSNADARRGRLIELFGLLDDAGQTELLAYAEHLAASDRKDELA